MTKIKEAEQKIKTLEEQLLLVSEKYRRLREVICPREGLSILFEYRMGEVTYMLKKTFLHNEVTAWRNADQMIIRSAEHLWQEAKRCIRQAVEQGN